ncbi:MAG: Cu/Zn superoxide dismutase [Mycobacterium sp.]|jgi:Cu-Zn family superoxide dismutase|nr:Cu/Zn superoxide dismutase [Mycobacterium sp.]
MVKPAAIAAVLLSVPALAVTACSPHQNPSNSPGTTPPVWTGSTAPGASPSSAAPGGSQQLKAQLAGANGTPVANATFDFSGGFATVTVETIGSGILTAGFHGMHIHSVGKCEANSVAPTGGAPGDFNSAGGHYQAPGHAGHPASGDLTSLEVRSDGSARLVTTTDAFTAADLLAGAKTAIIIHADPDNFANIPPDRYQQVNGAPPPDQITLATGDAGKRVACGVVNT